MMLVLSRRVGERVLIEDDIYVTVVAIDGRRIYLGIEAPDSVPILRSELVEKGRTAPRPDKLKRPRQRRTAPVALCG